MRSVGREQPERVCSSVGGILRLLLSAILGKLPHHLEGVVPALVVSDVAPALSTGV